MNMRLEQIGQWHRLFDELCSRAGFYDVSSLAARYCELAGKSSQKEHDTAVRNLNNWRSGRHIPRLRSLRVLEKILEVGDDPVLLEHWKELYRQANENDDDSPIDASKAPKRLSFRGWSEWRSVRVPLWTSTLGGVVLLMLGVAIGSIWSSGWRPWGGLADHAPLVVYKPEVWMAVGESKVIHAERGDCGRMPREWIDVVSSLPPAALGTFSDGGLARRNSKFCKGMTPARAIIFTARQEGVEEFNIEGDLLKVTIADASR
jgi:hypothetical protein